MWLAVVQLGLLLTISGPAAGLFFDCSFSATDSFIMTAEAKNIMTAMSSQRLKAWAYTYDPSQVKCVEVELNFDAGTYKFFSTNTQTGAQTSTSGTITVTRSRQSSLIKFTQTTTGTNIGLFGVSEGGSREWRFSYLNPTDVMINTCTSDGWFYIAYDMALLSSADLSSVSSTCFKDVLSTDLNFGGVAMQNLTTCTGYTT